ncbi:MAG: hypothetical protein IH997_07135 [Proteobacteria bacterium]|nr:hypothetical protein [Pseudomonadota bacterium]
MSATRAGNAPANARTLPWFRNARHKPATNRPSHFMPRGAATRLSPPLPTDYRGASAILLARLVVLLAPARLTAELVLAILLLIHLALLHVALLLLLASVLTVCILTPVAAHLPAGLGAVVAGHHHSPARRHRLAGA